MSPDTVMLSLRVPQNLVAELDDLAAKLQAQNPPGVRVTRTDVAIAALMEGVAGVRAKYVGGSKRPKKS